MAVVLTATSSTSGDASFADLATTLAGSWVALTLQANWGDASAAGWATHTFAYRVLGDGRVELRGGIYAINGSAASFAVALPAAITPAPAGITLWSVCAAWETGGTAAASRVYSISGNTQLVIEGIGPTATQDDAYLFDGQVFTP